MSWYSSVGIATGYGWTVGVLSPAVARYSSLLRSVQTTSWAHPAFYPMGTEGSSPRPKRLGGEAQLHLVPRSKMVELYLHSPRTTLHLLDRSEWSDSCSSLLARAKELLGPRVCLDVAKRDILVMSVCFVSETTKRI
jgi:hypothetical protein